MDVMKEDQIYLVWKKGMPRMGTNGGSWLAVATQRGHSQKGKYKTVMMIYGLREKNVILQLEQCTQFIIQYLGYWTPNILWFIIKVFHNDLQLYWIPKISKALCLKINKQIKVYFNTYILK